MLSIRNKMMIVALVISGSAFLGKNASAAAPAPEEVGATAQLGFAVPVIGDLKDIADPGIFLGMQAMHPVTPHSKYGVALSYASFGKESEDNVDTEVSIISTMALIHHDLGDNGHGAPFIETGLGFARTQVNIAASNAGGAAVTRGSNEEDISPTILLGVGFDMPLADNATFGVSLDYQHFFFKVGDVDGGGSLSLLAHLRV